MRLPCLSIRQPLVEFIFNGWKPVENRSWNWKSGRDWKKEGPLLVGIHASSNREWWNELDEVDQEGLAPEFGCVVGVAQLVLICRPESLPPHLSNHDSVNDDPDNWCWVLENPWRLRKTIPAKGQARLFYVEIPDQLVE